MKPLFLTSYDDEFADIYWQDWLPGYSAFLAPHFELQTMRFERQFGTFGSLLYNSSCRKLIAATIDALHAYDGRIIVMADCDMKIYRDFWPEIEALTDAPDFQMATSMDRIGADPVHCAGFIVCRSTPEVREFFAAWLEACNGADIGSVQNPFNALIHGGSLKVDALPKTFWTIGLGELARSWEPGDAVPIVPIGIYFHHANFTVGERNKRALMAAVALKVQKNKILWL